MSMVLWRFIIGMQKMRFICFECNYSNEEEDILLLKLRLSGSTMVTHPCSHT